MPSRASPPLTSKLMRKQAGWRAFFVAVGRLVGLAFAGWVGVRVIVMTEGVLGAPGVPVGVSVIVGTAVDVREGVGEGVGVMSSTLHLLTQTPMLAPE